MPNEFVARNGLIAQKDSSITGSLNVTNGITGSLFGTASFAITASWVRNSQSASYWSGSVTNALSASQSETASWVKNAQTASYWSGSITNVTSASFASTASYWSGSITNALSASQAETASWVKNAQTASYFSGSISNAISASYASTASYLEGFVTSASFASTASWIRNAQSSSYWSGSITNALSSSYSSTASYWSGSITNALSASQAETASWVRTAQTASYWSGSITNATSASFASTASYLLGSIASATNADTASNIIGGEVNYIPIWKSATILSSSNVYQSSSYVAIGTTIFDATNPEMFLVSSSSTINTVIGRAFINNYSQLNIINKNTGSSASSDIVATNDSGTETGNFVDLGINSSTFNGLIGGANEAYLYTTGSGLLIGVTTRGANARLRFFAGNDATVFPLIVTGSTTIITGSLLGTSSFAVSASWAPGGGGSTTTGDNMFQINGGSLSASKALNILTDGATITWHVSASYNAKVTLGGNRSLVISGSQDGDYYSLLVVQDDTGSRVLYVPISSSISSSAALSVTTGSSTTLVAWYRSGSYDWRSTHVTQSNSKILSASYTTAATSASNTPLYFAIQPFEAYYCVLEGSCQKATTNTGLKFGISTPTGSTILGEQWGPGTTALNMITRSLITSSNLLQTMNTATNLRQPFRLTFMVENSSSAGFVTVQLATVTSNVATLFSGSRLIYEKAIMV